MQRYWRAIVGTVVLPGFREIGFCLVLLFAGLGSAGSLAAQDAAGPESAAREDGSDMTGSAAAAVQPPAPEVKLKLSRKYDMDRIGDRGIGDGFNLFSLNRERALGESMARRLDGRLQLVTDPEVNAYVNRVVQHLAINSDAKVPFTVRIVKNEDANATSFPGGYLYVNSGLIAACPDEATFVGILAHEVGHVAARHVTKALTRRMLFRVGAIPLMFITGGIAVAVDNAAGVAMPIYSAKFVRDSEREADLLAVEYTYAAGYDPEAFVQFFETIAAKQKFKGSKFINLMFSSHLMTEDRVRRAQAAIAAVLPERDKYVIDTSDFRQVKARLSEVAGLPCRDSNDKPVLVGSGKQCTGTDSDGRPKLKRRVDKLQSSFSAPEF